MFKKILRKIFPGKTTYEEKQACLLKHLSFKDRENLEWKALKLSKKQREKLEYYYLAIGLPRNMYIMPLKNLCKKSYSSKTKIIAPLPPRPLKKSSDEDLVLRAGAIITNPKK